MRQRCSLLFSSLLSCNTIFFEFYQRVNSFSAKMNFHCAIHRMIKIDDPPTRPLDLKCPRTSHSLLLEHFMKFRRSLLLKCDTCSWFFDDTPHCSTSLIRIVRNFSVPTPLVIPKYLRKHFHVVFYHSQLTVVQ